MNIFTKAKYLRPSLNISVFLNISVENNSLKNVPEFTGNNLCRGPFLNKAADCSSATLLNRDSRYWCFCQFSVL